MSNDAYLLITLFYEESMLRVAIKVPEGALADEVFSFPMEPENKARIFALLPLHVRSCGPIINVEQIFDIVF